MAHNRVLFSGLVATTRWGFFINSPDSTGFAFFEF